MNTLSIATNGLLSSGGDSVILAPSEPTAVVTKVSASTVSIRKSKATSVQGNKVKLSVSIVKNKTSLETNENVVQRRT